MRARLVPLLVLAAALSACGGRSHDRVVDPTTQPFGAQPVTVTLESPGAGVLPGGLFGGAFYFAGEEGQQYSIRITNNTAARVEAVVSVDGRDVVTGQLGDYRKQRGYIIEPFGSVVVDGFRQSLDQVAAFRFTGLAGSYTALQGTPQHAGVIGVAVFEERASKKKQAPLAAGPGDPFPAKGGATARRDHDGGAAPREEAAKSSPEPFSAQRGVGGRADSPSASEAAPASAPADDAVALGEGGSAATGFAPPPVPRNELGTEYGDSQSSSVHEVEFKRKHKRKPTSVISVFYDSARGLQARGVPIGGAFEQQGDLPQRFPPR
ncbi:MAG TPA: hypothetical protein VG755_20215 [Nannocystaceae bacterium]|nr:hypothetical protein [Nannocystaceae bacterium]